MKQALMNLAVLILLSLGGFAHAGTFEGGVDRPGFDYANFQQMSPRAILCQNRCDSDTRCRAWTYVKPGVQGANARCWLKDRVPKAVKSNCCTSGIK